MVTYTSQIITALNSTSHYTVIHFGEWSERDWILGDCKCTTQYCISVKKSNTHHNSQVLRCFMVLLRHIFLKNPCVPSRALYACVMYSRWKQPLKQSLISLLRGLVSELKSTERLLLSWMWSFLCPIGGARWLRKASPSRYVCKYCIY